MGSTFAAFVTVLSLIGFLIATVYGVLVYKMSAFSKPVIVYITSIAAMNAVFRMFTLWHRVTGKTLPNWTTEVALTLQVGLAYVIVVVMALGYERVRNERA